MDVIVAGLGSIGQRHARVLAELGADVTTFSRRPGVGDTGDISALLREKPDALLLIATETGGHCRLLKIADEAAHRGPVVVEKPLGLKSSEFVDWRLDRPLWVAYNMRYLPVVQAFKAALEKLSEPVLSVQAYVGQDLAAWRPGRDVSQTYSARMDAGGGVLRDLSHELDLVSWLWGPPERMTALGGRMGTVTLDSDDCWNILMRTVTGVHISLGLNYFDRPARRFLHAVCASTTLCADLVEGTLRINTETRDYPAGRDDSYRAMWRDILNACEKGGHPDACDLKQGLNILLSIENCEKSAKTPAWICQ